MVRTIAKRWLVSGAVQGVGFRFFVEHKAASLGLSGWVRNLDDGRLEVYATGPAARLDELAGALYTGPPNARVRGVEEQPASVEKLRGFSVR